MNTRRCGWIVAGVCWAWFNALIAPSSSAQTVQLPSIQTFSYSGSVMVPDSGATSLGGNRSFATGDSSRGGFAGSSGLSSSLSAHATIIDLQAMDREIRGLNETDRRVDSIGRRIDPLEEAKSLVRQARKWRADGNESGARSAYRMAIAKLDALARLPRAVAPIDLAHDPRQLAILARSEFFAVYPDERLMAAGAP